MEALSAGRTECQFDQIVGHQYLTGHPVIPHPLEESITLFARVFQDPFENIQISGLWQNRQYG